jgi:hypothetical protein
MKPKEIIGLTIVLLYLTLCLYISILIIEKVMY